MKLKSLGILFMVTLLHGNVFASDDELVTQGTFSYMAFIYYPDETVVDSTGLRFIRDAILIKLDVLISSAIDDSVFEDAAVGFPQKTLMARAGSVTVDNKFTLNDDEDEQEQEVIHIVRPLSHNISIWWYSDITILMTLLPFKATFTVGIVALDLRQSDFAANRCLILVYTPYNSSYPGSKRLMRLPVDMLSMSKSSCGPYYNPETMMCSADADEHKNSDSYPDFCLGNGGGPLICADEVVGIQTYINNDCKQPHLYQVLYAWKKFISCAADNKCNHIECTNTCHKTNKDTVVTDISTTVTLISDETPKSSVQDTQSSPVSEDSYAIMPILAPGMSAQKNFASEVPNPETTKLEETTTEVNKNEQITTKEIEIKKTETEDSKTENTQTEEIKTVESGTENTQTEEIKSDESKTENTQTEEMINVENKTENTPTEEIKTVENKTENTATEEIKTVENKTENTPTEEIKTVESKTEAFKLTEHDTTQSNIDESIATATTETKPSVSGDDDKDRIGTLTKLNHEAKDPNEQLVIASEKNNKSTKVPNVMMKIATPVAKSFTSDGIVCVNQLWNFVFCLILMFQQLFSLN